MKIKFTDLEVALLAKIVDSPEQISLDRCETMVANHLLKKLILINSI
jgi:hypothetical protein